MSNIIKLVQGDTAPALVCTITDETTGAVVNIAGATVVLKMRAVGSTTLQATVTGSVTNGSAGQVTFFPISNPLMLSGAAGNYEGEIVITFPDTSVQTVYQTLKFLVKAEF